MLIQLNWFGIILLITSLISIYTIYYLKNKRDNHVIYYFSLLLIVLIIDLLSQSLECLLTPFYLKSFFGQLCVIGYALIPVFWLFFIYPITHNNQSLPRKIQYGLLIVPLIVIFSLITNTWTHAYFIENYWANAGFTTQLAYNYNWGFYLGYIYDFIIGLINLIIIFKAVLNRKSIYKRIYSIIFVATIIGVFFGLLSLTSIYPNFGFAALGYIFSLVLLIMSIFLYDSLDLTKLFNFNVVENINEGVCFFNNYNQLLTVNKSAELINLNKDQINKNSNEIFKEDQELLNFLNDNNVDTIEIQRNGKWLEINKQKIIKKNTFLGNILMVKDVSSQVFKLKEKEVLIKEVHNRVKSNLQIILSLINIDLHYHPDEPLIVLEDTRIRLNYMSSLHELIYKSNNLNEINIKEYFPRIAEGILSLSNSAVKIHYLIETDYMIDFDLAVSLGLILTEIIDNTIKYAFPEGDEGNFYIKFIKINDNYVFDLCNDGEPLSDDFDINSNSTLGMTVVKSLTEGLNGTLTVIPCDGAHFKIICPV